MYNTTTTMDQDLQDKFEPWVFLNNERNSLSQQAVRLCENYERKMGLHQLESTKKGTRENSA